MFLFVEWVSVRVEIEIIYFLVVVTKFIVINSPLKTLECHTQQHTVVFYCNIFSCESHARIEDVSYVRFGELLM